MNTLMARLSIRQRMLVCMLVLLLPLALFVGLLIAEINKDIAATEREIAGAIVINPLTELQAALIAAGNEYDAGAVNGATLQRVTNAASELAQTLQAHVAVVGLDRQPVAPAQQLKLGGVADWQSVVAQLQQQVQMLGVNDKGAWQNIDKTISLSAVLIGRVADASGLTLDPDLDSYYLMDAAAFAVPDMVAQTGEAQKAMQQIAMGRVSAKDPDALAHLYLAEHALAEDEGQRVKNSINTALAEDANVHGTSPTLARLVPLLAQYQAATTEAVALLDETADNNSVPSLESVQQRFNRLKDTTTQLSTAAKEELRVLLQLRIDDLAGYRTELVMKGGVAIVLGLVLFFLVSQSIVGPLTKMIKVMTDLSGGNLDVTVPCKGQQDELGRMAAAVQVFHDNAQLMRTVSETFEASVMHAVELVSGVAGEIGVAAKDLTTQAGQGHVRLADLCKDIEIVTGGSKEITAAGEQLKQAINEISAQVSVSADTTRRAASEAEHVRQTAEALEQATDKISNVVTIISAITNKIALLALNATIESARAGEAGKGFAVVASEVKTLARQTEESTAEIAQAVAAIQVSSQQTMAAIQSIGGVIKQLSEGATVIAAAVEEQGAVADSIAQNMTLTTTKLDNVAQNANALIELTASSSAAATQSMQASIEFGEQFNKLRGEVRSFVSTMQGSDKQNAA